MKTSTKKLIAKIVAVSFILTVSLVVAVATDTSTLTVLATVEDGCHFSTTTSIMSFGALNPASSSNANASISPTIWCTNGSAGTVTAGNGNNYNGGSNRMTDGNGNFLPYSLSVITGTVVGTGKSTPIPITINGTIHNSDYINLPPADYTDTVVLTVSP